DALESNGLAVPVGTVAGNGYTLDVTVGEKLDSLDDLRSLPLETAEGKPTVTLGKIASVELSAQDTAMAARVNGKDAVALIVTPTSSANIVATSQKVHDALDDIQPMIGDDAEFSVIFDQAPYITLSINSLTKEGAAGLVMAVVVILLFLLSVRSTLVTAISIPLSLLLAFIGMLVSGYTLNILTLSALTITIGRVVDDSIVVIENIKRHIEYGGPKRRAIVNAVREVSSAVTASTIVTLLVYVPIAFVSGTVGELFKPFALTVVLAMLASLLVSLTIVPVLAYWFVKPSTSTQSEFSESTSTGAISTPDVAEENFAMPENVILQEEDEGELANTPQENSREENHQENNSPQDDLKQATKIFATALFRHVTGLAKEYVKDRDANRHDDSKEKLDLPPVDANIERYTTGEIAPYFGMPPRLDFADSPSSDDTDATPQHSHVATTSPTFHSAEEPPAIQTEETENPWLYKAYLPALRETQKRPLHTLAASVIILIATGLIFPFLNVNLMSGSSQNFISLTQAAPAGTDFETLVAHAKTAETALMDVAGVETVTSTIGGGSMMGSSASISYFVTVAEGADQQVLVEKLDEVLAKNSSGDEVGNAGTSSLMSSTIEVDIVASDDKTLAEANEQLMGALKSVEGAKSVTSNLQAEQPSVQITVNREAAGKLGLTENAVVGMISSQMFSASIGQITIDNIDTDIYLKMADPVTTLDELKKMKVMGMPLSSIATVEEVKVVPTVTTVNGQRTATISIEPSNPDDLGSLNSAVSEAIASVDLPEGAMTSEAGAAEDLEQMFGQLGLAMLAAILLIYVTLVWIFKSLGQPLLLLISIPFAAIGSFVALLVTRQPLGLAAMVGLLMLIGIVVTNAIVLIDLINQYRRAGMDMDEAITLGAQRRVRPIVMTAISTIAAMAPIGLGISGQEGFISQPMALTVIGGLFSSTALTLVLLPVLYRLTQKNWTPPETELARELED
ncbi:MAG: efflux RND transporter permease subunit, partial [Actinomycetaceae bacterium]|nr:efflux RND transporter permease subunit [Actinomycetaceae bacterium]